MGYTTEYYGSFKLSEPLTPEQKAYLKRFAETRRMKRDVSKLDGMEDPAREAVGLPFGQDGEYFTGGLGFYGQDNDESVVDQNHPPADQPGLWCQWVPNEDGTAIEWDGGEKFYHAKEWLQYMIHNFFIPWGYVQKGKSRQ